jgi:general secretion pathway protein F
MSFAQALRTQAPVFSPTYIAVVEAGEKSGQLSGVLDRLANDLEERQALSAKVWGAALYPLIVSLIAVVIVTFLVTYVVPQVANVFAHSKRGLPTLTVVMLAISGFMRHQGWLLLVAIIGGGVGFSWALRQPAFATRFDARWLRLPLIGRLAQGYNAARFAGTLSMLTAAGVPILQALQAAAQTLTNRALQAAAQDILVDVREGAALSSALSRQKRFPTLLTMFARLGEQTGQLPEMLNRVAQQLSGEVQRKSMQLATILEPLLIVVMGLMVMLIVLAVLLPIIQLNQLAR